MASVHSVLNIAVIQSKSLRILVSFLKIIKSTCKQGLGRVGTEDHRTRTPLTKYCLRNLIYQICLTTEAVEVRQTIFCAVGCQKRGCIVEGGSNFSYDMHQGAPYIQYGGTISAAFGVFFLKHAILVAAFSLKTTTKLTLNWS